MIDKKRLLIFLVDNDKEFLRTLEADFYKRAYCAVRTFATGELCLENLHEKPDVVIMDYNLDAHDRTAADGILTLDRIREHDKNIPVIILSSQDKIGIAVACMRHHAFDYIVKSETACLRLQNVIMTIGRYRKMEYELNWYMDRM